MDDPEKPAAKVVRTRRKFLGLVLFAFFIAASAIYSLTFIPAFAGSAQTYIPNFSSISWTSSIIPDPTILRTKHLGGLPGFQVLENVWVHDGTIYMFSPDRGRLPSKSRSVSGETGWEVFTHPSEERIESAKKALVLQGTTLFVNDGAKRDEWHYLSSYYHLIGEIFLGGVSAIASLPSKSGLPTEMTRSSVRVPSLPKRLIIPWKGATGWRDKEGLGEMVLSGVLDGNVLEPVDWEALSDEHSDHGGWVYMQRAVIIDRWASHRHNPLSISLNKMSASIFALPHPPFFFNPARSALLRNLSIPEAPTRRDPSRSLRRVPKIVYVDRQESERRLSEEAHAALAVVLAEMEARGKARVGHKKMDVLSHAEQVKAVSDADILIGVHGEGLTHQLWMPEGGVVIELFPPDSFLPENQIVADVLHHEFIPIWNDYALSREEWEALPRQHNQWSLFDGTEIPLDKVYFRLLLEELVQRMVSP
ncbi:hypothetical protein IAT38_000903 [Cryptococcus sp. DSM 104549]